MKKIVFDNNSISFMQRNQDDYISLTDMAKHKNAESTGLVISHWLSTRYAVEFLRIWEQVNNPSFNVTEFRNIRSNAGSNGFVLSAKQWIERTNAIGLISKEWRDAHADLQGNVRDYATVNQLICLSNMESLNSVLIKEGLPQSERLQKLNQIAISQMTVLESIGENKLLK